MNIGELSGTQQQEVKLGSVSTGKLPRALLSVCLPLEPTVSDYSFFQCLPHSLAFFIFLENTLLIREHAHD